MLPGMEKIKILQSAYFFIYLLASSFASWNMACCVSTTASGLSDGARVVLSVLRSEQKGGGINCLFYSVELVSPV